MYQYYTSSEHLPRNARADTDMVKVVMVVAGIQEIGGPRVCQCLWRAAVMDVFNSQRQRWTKCSRERVEDSRNSRVRQSVVPGDRG